MKASLNHPVFQFEQCLTSFFSKLKKRSISSLKAHKSWNDESQFETTILSLDSNIESYNYVLVFKNRTICDRMRRAVGNPYTQVCNRLLCTSKGMYWPTCDVPKLLNEERRTYFGQHCHFFRYTRKHPCTGSCLRRYWKKSNLYHLLFGRFYRKGTEP